MTDDAIYRAYLTGYTRASLGGRLPKPGLLSRLFCPTIEVDIAKALGISDAVSDRGLRNVADVEKEVKRVLPR